MNDITFACRTMSIDQLLRCTLNLNNTEMNLLKYMVNCEKECDIKNLITVMKKNRTTVQRALNVLIENKLIVRRQINLENGGYFFVYSPLPKNKIKEKINENFNGFTRAVEEAIEKW